MTSWAIWALPVLWQTTLLALVVLVIDLLLRRVVWPQLLHALWMLVPLRVFLPPTVTSPIALAPEAAAFAPRVDPAPWFLAWIAGVALFGLLALRAHRRARRRLEDGAIAVDVGQRAVAARLGLRRRVLVLRGRHAGSPVVYGLLRPRVVLPRDLDDPREIEHVLLHEYAHVRRRDLWMQTLFGLANLLCWFHPLVYVARRRAAALREVCCDARVASVLREETPAYRATLLRIAENLLAPPQPGLAGFLGGPAHILARLRWLERGEWTLSRRKRVATACAVFVLAVTLVPHAQASVIDPALRGLRAERAAAEARLQHVIDNPHSTGCFELKWSVLRWMELENKVKESK
ncbi:MAG: M56 family metallopeptidase [Planctomycetota bacterium]